MLAIARLPPSNLLEPTWHRVAGQRTAPQTNPTDADPLLAKDLVGTRIAISDVRAGRGGDDHLGGAAGDGGDAYGLKTSTTMGAAPDRLSLEGIVAGEGGSPDTGGGAEGTPGIGGLAAGVDIHNGAYLTLDHVDVDGVEGGGADLTPVAGAASGIRIEDPDTTSLDTFGVSDVLGGSGGVAGSATGLEVNLYGEATLERLDIRGVRGGDGVSDGGDATGLVLEDLVPLLWQHVLVATIRGGTLVDAATADATGILSDADASATLRNLTCHDVSAPSGASAGVVGDPGYPLLIVDSIISDTGALCLRGAPDNPETHLTATHAILHGCDAAASHAVAHDTVDKAPQFVNAPEGDLRVQPGSPAGDAALAESGYCGEPDPNGCRANLGFFANTVEATSTPGAKHCACDDD